MIEAERTAMEVILEILPLLFVVFIILFAVSAISSLNSKDKSSNEEQQPNRAMIIIQSSVKRNRKLWIVVSIFVTIMLLLYLSTYI